jgi:hypothetical protein
LTAITAIADTYWTFPVTIAVLGVGALTGLMVALRIIRGSNAHNRVLVSWALAAIVCACGIALKSPHYFILWLIPLYMLIAAEAPGALDLLRSKWAIGPPVSVEERARRSRYPSVAASLIYTGCTVLLAIDLLSFNARFLSSNGDALESSIRYVNTHVPANAIVAVVGSAGPELTRPYVQFPAETRAQLYVRTRSRTRLPWLLVYWSLTNPIPTTLRHLNSYCRNVATFHGFNDNAEVCRLVPRRLTRVASVEGDDDASALTRR